MTWLLLDREAAYDADARASWLLPAPPGFNMEVGSRTARDNPLSKEQSIDHGLIIGSRMDRLTSIAAFVRVVENGGFTAAARHLNLSPTMVSNRS
jgi:hypothetical protein